MSTDKFNVQHVNLAHKTVGQQLVSRKSKSKFQGVGLTRLPQKNTSAVLNAMEELTTQFKRDKFKARKAKASSNNLVQTAEEVEEFR